jgi:hypothetical protein
MDIGPASRDLPMAVEAYKKAGWPWVASQVDPRPVPSPAEDGAPDLEAAINSYDEKSFNKAIDALNRASIDELYHDIEAPLAPFIKTINLAVVASAKSRVNFRRDYDLGPYVLFPEYAKEKALVKFLTFGAEAKCASGDVATAVKYLRAAHGLSVLSGEEPNLISMLVEIACQAIVDRGYQNCAAILRTNPAALADLAKSYTYVAKMDFGFHLRAEAYNGLAILRNVDQYGGPFGLIKSLNSSGGDSDGNSMPKQLDPLKLRRDGIAPDIISRAFLDKQLRYWSSIQTTGDKPEEISKEMDRAEHQLADKHSFSNALSAILMPIFSQAGIAIERMRADQEVTAAFLEGMETHAKTGAYPKAIGDIRGTWIDPFNGKPLKVKVSGESFRVYSVGPDGIDNGGLTQSETKRSDQYDMAAAYPRIKG